MLEQKTTIPARRAELVFRLQGEQGQYVVKDRRTEAYYTIGDEEFFLLTRLDGKRTTAALCAAYEASFGQPLSREDLDEFVQRVRSWGFLQSEEGETDGTPALGARPADRRKCLHPPSEMRWRWSYLTTSRREPASPGRATVASGAARGRGPAPGSSPVFVASFCPADPGASHAGQRPSATEHQ